MTTTVTLLFFLSAISSAVAQGVIAQISFPDGKGGTTSHAGLLPGQGGANNSPIRSVSSQDPNYGTNNPAITCGPDSKPGNEVAEIAPGATMSFVWKDASGGPWAHDIGPIITYMASCGDQDCNSAGDPADLLWFKTEEVGRKDNSDVWVQADVKNGAPSTATVPQNLEPGNYMIRHEIIALHLATEIGKAEFYPGCVAVRVTGTGSAVPQISDLVEFPGAYKDSDPGIFTPNIFDSTVTYVFPGPAIATIGADVVLGRARAENEDTVGRSPHTGTSGPMRSSRSQTSTEGRLTNKDSDALQSRSIFGVLLRLASAALRTGESVSVQSRTNTAQPPTIKRSIAKDQDTMDLQPRRVLGVLLRLLGSGLRIGSSSLESRTNEHSATQVSPHNVQDKEVIMVPRRYSRIMKRLVDDLAKEGKLPPL